MTIKELIEALQMFPEDAEVKVADFDRKGNLIFVDIKSDLHIVEYEDGFLFTTVEWSE